MLCYFILFCCFYFISETAVKAEIGGASQNIQVKVVNYLNQWQSFLLSPFRSAVKNNLWLNAGKAGDEDHNLALRMFWVRMTCSSAPAQQQARDRLLGQYE